MLVSEHVKQKNSEGKSGEGMIGFEWERTSQIFSLSGKIVNRGGLNKTKWEERT